MDQASNGLKNRIINQGVKNQCAQIVPKKKRIFSIKELVSEIGATEWFWRTQIWDGQLPYIQVGRKMFVDSNDVESFIQRNKFIN